MSRKTPNIGTPLSREKMYCVADNRAEVVDRLVRESSIGIKMVKQNIKNVSF